MLKDFFMGTSETGLIIATFIMLRKILVSNQILLERRGLIPNIHL